MDLDAEERNTDMATMKSSAVIDFSRNVGRMKPLHGVNNSPMAWDGQVRGFAEAGIPFCRLHDAGGPFGGTHYVDVNNVFPNFGADPASPESYDFAFTDAYIQAIAASGAEVFYRLGCTIENNFRIKAYNIYPPKDYAKWAEICAGIVRHYTQGWGNGFHYGFRYWEIWNEPENPPMWQGTKEQYFELYRVASTRLKAEFPKIKVGGYASCGFYAVSRPDPSAFHQSFVTWFHDFLDYLKNPATAAPLDFFSWHLYTSKPDEIRCHSDYVAHTLREKGFDQTESIFNEWNYSDDDPRPEVRWGRMKNHYGASFVAAAFAILQNSDTDKAMYYDAYPQRAYCGLYEFPSMLTTPTYDVFKAYNALYRLGGQCHAGATELALKIVAASDGQDGAALVANHNPEACTLQLDIHGGRPLAFCRVTDAARRSELVDFDGWKLELPPYSLAVLSSFDVMASVGKPSEPAERKVIHGGLDSGN
jgi:hypothetical protein